jgi:hypothetical protein
MTKTAKSVLPGPPRFHDRLCIVGFADGHRADAPFTDENMEFWGINRLHVAMQGRWHRWFNLHDLPKFHGQDLEHLTWLQTFGGPVYLRPDDMDKFQIPHQIAYPKEAILEAFPRRYFNNTISWLIALAILMEYKEIHLYGVDMAQDDLLNAEYCVGPETRVLTADLHWVPVSDIRIGDRLVGFDEESTKQGVNYRSYRTAIVEAADELILPSYRFTMADGTKLVSSSDHRWMTNRSAKYKWSKTVDMQSAPKTPTRRSKIVKLTDTWDHDRTWGAGFLAAAFDGEGHLSANKRPDQSGYSVSLGFSQRPNEMSAVVDTELAVRRFTTNSTVGRDGTKKYQIAKGRAEIMRFLGSIRPPRLLAKFDPDKLGIVHTKERVAVVEKENIGLVPVIGLRTSTRTFIAEGFASHNSHQRPSCEYFLGVAEARGITVVLPPGSDLLKTAYLYGFEDQEIWTGKLLNRLQELGGRKEQMKQRLAQIDAERGNLIAGINQLDGAMQQCQYNLKNWLPLSPGTAFDPTANGHKEAVNVPMV